MKGGNNNHFTPWEHTVDQEFDKIPMMTRSNLKSERLNLVQVSAMNHIAPPLQSPSISRARQRQVHVQRQLSYRQRAQQPRIKMHLKHIQLSPIMGIGKGLTGEITKVKKQLQGKMMEYLLLIYLSEELKQQASLQKGQIIRQKYQCLFPLIGINGSNKEKYKIRRSLNDLINFKRI